MNMTDTDRQGDHDRDTQADCHQLGDERHRRTAMHLGVRALLAERPYPYPKEGESVQDFAERAGVDETQLLDIIARQAAVAKAQKERRR